MLSRSGIQALFAAADADGATQQVVELETDGDGMAFGTVDAPQRSGTYVMLAVAVEGCGGLAARLGSTTAEVRVRPALTITATAAAVMSVGDAPEVVLEVRNAYKATVKVEALFSVSQNV